MRELFFKCIGAILVLYTGAAMGWRKGNAAMRRVQVLADICAFLGAVRDDLHFRCGRTEEILAAAQQNTRLSALPLYFSDLASGCGLQTELDNALCRTEREIAGVTRREERVLLRGALEGLGGCPAQEEEQRLAYAQTQLETALDAARAEAAQQRRLYRTLGLSLGGAAALLLLHAVCEKGAKRKMNIDFVFKIAAIGIIVAVLNQLLIRSGREEQAMMTTLAGLIVVLMMIISQISVLFDTIKDLFAL